MEIINLHKKCNRTKAVAKTVPKAPKSGYHLFLREQVDEMIGENQKSYRSFVSIELKETKQNPARLSEYNDRARQMQNEAEDSQNEKAMIDRPTAKHTKKVPKPPEFVDADSDDSDDEQEPTSKQPQKASKASEFVDTGTNDEQERQSKKVPKTSEYSDNEQEPAVKCIVMYSTEDE